MSPNWTFVIGFLAGALAAMWFLSWPRHWPPYPVWDEEEDGLPPFDPRLWPHG